MNSASIFQVEVERAVPDASSCAFETINVIGLDALNVPLTLCKPDQPRPVNPNNGETVNGVWNWEDPEMILNSRSYNVTFTPTDRHNFPMHLPGSLQFHCPSRSSPLKMSYFPVPIHQPKCCVSGSFPKY